MNVNNPPTNIENFQIIKTLFQPNDSVPDFLEKNTEPSILPPLHQNSADFEGRHIFISLNQKVLSVQPNVVGI